MAAPALLSDDEVTAALAEASLAGWERADDRLRATFRFEDFVAAFSFMTAIAIHAERLNHHPEWSNVYNRVTIELTTHDSGGITSYDLELARLATARAPGGGE